MKSATRIWNQALRSFPALTLLLGLSVSVPTAEAVNYTNTLTYSQSGLSSTNASPLIYVPNNPYAVGDMVYFNGTTVTANPFGTTANRYYVIYSSGNNIKVATTYNGTAVNAANNITGTGTAQKHPSWLSTNLWLGGAAPNDNSSIAGFVVAGGGRTPPGGIVVNSNITVYGLGYVNSSGDILFISGSSNGTSLYPLTFATADGSTPKLSMTNSAAGVVFLGHSDQACALKINGTQGLIFNSGPGGAISSGSGVTAVSTGPGKDTRVYNTVNWADFSGGIQIERGQVSQQNGTSVLPTTQNLTVGNNQTLANNLLAAFALNGRDSTVGALNGVALGRIYNGSGTSIFTVGNNGSNGVYAGSIGYNFDGTLGAGNLWFHKAGSGTQTVSGPIAGNGTTVTVDGGTLILSGNNVYKGVTTVNSGAKLVLNSSQTTTNSIIVANGGTLDVNVSGASQLTPYGLTNASTASTIEFLNLNSTTVAPVKPTVMALNGAVTINIATGTLTPGNSYPLINWTTITGAGSFTLGSCPFTGTLTTNGTTLTLNITAGTNVWTGANNGNWDTTTTGNWTVNGSAGTYVDASLTVFDDTASGTPNVTVNQLVKPGAVSVNNSSLAYAITASSANYIGGAGSLSKAGSGTLTLDGPNAYSGGTTLSAGQLNVNYGGSNATNSAIGSGPLTIAGGTLDNTSAGDVTLAPAIAQSWNGDFAYAGSAHSLNLGSGGVTLGANRVVTVTNNTLGVSGSIGDSGSAYSLTKNGNGTLALFGASTYSGGLALNAGTVQVGNATALGTGGSQLNGGQLDLNGVSLANSNNINSSAFTLTNSSASPGALALNSTVNSDFTIGVGVGGITVARLICAAPSHIVTKTGTGTLTFNGAGHNNLMALVVNSGTVICGNSGGFSADRGLTNNGGVIKLAGPGSGSFPNANLFNDAEPFVVNSGTVDMNGWNETVGAISGSGGLIVNNGSTNSIIGVGSDNNSATFYGSFQNGTGTLGVTKVGTGIQTFGSVNSYSGPTTVSAGNLQAGVSHAFSPNSDVTVAGLLDLNAFDNAIGGLNGAGTVDTEIAGTPTLTLGANGGSGNFSGTLQDGAGTLALVKAGSGTQTLAGANNYNGTTIVSNGTLIVASSLSGSGAVTVYGPSILNPTNSNPSIAGAVTLMGTNATLSLLDGGIGTLSLNGGLSLNNSNVLRFDVSSSGVDQIAVTGAFSQAGKTIIYLNQINPPNAQTYTLISGATGINAANFSVGTTLSGYSLSLNSDGVNLYLVVALNAPATAYWHNRTGTAWNGHSGSLYNWDTDQSSGTSTATYPAASSDVYFAADTANNFATTLGTDIAVKSLTFNVANNVTIAGTNTLTLNGPVTVNSGAGSNTISASAVALAADESISVADTANTLAIASPITGAHALTISGSGTVALSGSSTYTGNTTINSGTLALGNPTNSLPDTAAVTINGGTLSIGANNDTVGVVTLTSGSINGVSGVLKGSSYNMQGGTVAANLGGAAAMTVNGSVLLASNSTYSGGTTLTGGTLQLGASGALGSAGLSVGSGTTLDLNGQTIANTITYSGAGTLANYGTAAAGVTTDANLYNNLTIDATGGNITVARLIGNAIRVVTKTGANTLTFNGAGHNNLVSLVVGSGTVICANSGGYSADRGMEIDNGGTVMLAGPGSGGSYPNANLINDSAAFNIDGIFDLNGWNETIGTLVGTGGNGVVRNSAVGTNSTVTVGANSVTAEFNGAIQDGGGVLALAKAGTGVQTLSGTATYSGNTTINNGQLLVSASATSPNSTFVINTNGGLGFHTDTAFLMGGLSGSGDVNLVNDGSVAIALAVGANNASTTYSGMLSDTAGGATLVKVGTGTLTLMGANTYTGLTTISNGVLVISSNYVAAANFTVHEGAAIGVTGNTPATSAQVGTLTLGMTGSGASTIVFKNLPNPANAPLTVNTLSPIGGAGSVVISNNAVLAVGTYNLINYTTLGGVGFSAFTLGTLPPGTVAHLANNTSVSPNVIQLVVTAIAPQIWSGAVNTNWDINTTANWKVNGAATNYYDFSPVLFDDTVGGGQTLVNLATNVQPVSLTVSNNTKNYTFTTVNGSGINCSGAFVKNGSGTLTLVNQTNAFAGGVSVNAGTVVLAGASLGTNSITDNATVVFSNGTQLVSAAINGSGMVVQNSSGTTELSASNTYSGGTLIARGTLQVDNTNAIGTGTVTLGDGVSANSATFLAPSVGGTFGNNNPIVVAAGGTGIYKIQFVGNPDYHLTGGIALNNALTLSVTAGGAMFIDAPITSGAGNPMITIDGNNSSTKFVYLTADNSATLTANFVVTNKGDLKSGNINSLSAANAIALDSTSLLDTGAKNLTIAGLNDFGGAGGAVANSGGGTFLTLGGSGNYAFSGPIGGGGGVLKQGTGTQTLSGVSTYTGPTVVSNGTLIVNGTLDGGGVTVAGGVLAGAGTLKGATTVQINGTLSPAGSGIGTLAVSNSLTLQGTLAVDINKTAATQDQIIGLTSVTYGGTLAVNNQAGTLTTTDSFKLFSAGTYAGAFASITPAVPAAGLVWNTNTLTIDGTLRIASGVATNPTNITAVVVGNQLQLSWPADHTGWTLEMQTNSLVNGVSSNTNDWMRVSGSSSSNSASITIDSAKPAGFYRLVYP